MNPNSKKNEHHQFRANIEMIKIRDFIYLETEAHVYFNSIPDRGNCTWLVSPSLTHFNMNFRAVMILMSSVKALPLWIHQVSKTKFCFEKRQRTTSHQRLPYPFPFKVQHRCTWVSLRGATPVKVMGLLWHHSSLTSLILENSSSLVLFQ